MNLVVHGDIKRKEIEIEIKVSDKNLKQKYVHTYI
jgi:hypothetical protein